MANNGHGVLRARGVTGTHSVDEVVALNAKVDALTRDLNALKGPSHVMWRKSCFGSMLHWRRVSQLFGSQLEEQPLLEHLQSGWRNHPNFSWGNQHSAKPTPPPGLQQ
ncbi:hypothetical protein MLD38_021191 [Melastoma candidum]|uniref:Uncharacterized protein n=1 Tax=Melastoma candidum TaxID=119954 RepID=A0ACB9QFU3_9MYRT|nr:hypothetical protein MLD38_021191 [Melastoma candidum]